MEDREDAVRSLDIVRDKPKGDLEFYLSITMGYPMQSIRLSKGRKEHGGMIGGHSKTTLSLTLRLT